MSDFAGFTRTQAELEALLREISGLVRARMTPEAYLRRFMELTLYAVGARGGAIWMPQGQEFQKVFTINFEQTLHDSDEAQKKSIQQALRDIVQDLRPITVPPGGVHGPSESGRPNRTTLPIFYVPVARPEVSKTSPVLAVLQTWGPPELNVSSYKDVVAFLQLAAEHAAIFLQLRRMENVAANHEKLQNQVRFLAELSGQTNLQSVGLIVANWGKELTGCDRCAVLYQPKPGKLKPLAVSHVENIDEHSSLVRSQLALGQDVITAGQATLYRKAQLKAEESGDISDYFYHSHAQEVFVVPIRRPDGKIRGLLLLEAHKDKPIDENVQKAAAMVASQAGRALTVAEEVSSLPFYSFWKRVLQVRERWLGEERRATWLRVGLPLVLVLTLALAPWKLMVRGECVVSPVVRGTVAAEESGRLVEVLVSEGDTVQVGQVVARMDDTSLRQQIQVSLKEKAKYEAEADRQQVLGDEGAKKVALIEAERVGQEIEYYQKQIEKHAIRSPIAGVVMTPDLKSRVGEVLQMGGRFCEVGNLENWQIVARIKESEVTLVDDQLRTGRPVEIRFRLHSFPDREWIVPVQDRSAISQLPEPSGSANVFLLRSPLPVTPALREALKAGYTGRGKIHAGWRPGIVLVGRKLVNYLRVRWFV